MSLGLVAVLILSMIPVMQTEAEAYAKAYPVPELTGNQAQDIVNVAMSQLGYAEGSDGGTVYGAWWSGVTKYGDYTYAGWCAMFACWCANQAGAGMNISYDKSCALVQNLMNYLDKNGTVKTSFSATPQAGDFIFFGYSSGSASHVAIVTDYNAKTNVVTFVGGNQSNKVKKCTIDWSKSGRYGSQRIVGFGRPEYKNITLPDKPVVSSEKNAYLEGDDITVSWKAVAGSTGYAVSVYKDGDLLNEKNTTGTSYKIRSAAPGSYTVKVKATNEAGSSSAGSCKFTVTDVLPTVRLWISNSAGGDAVTDYKIGSDYYLCYELYDEVSGTLMDDLRTYSYTVALTATAPDGAQVLSETLTADSGSSLFFNAMAGGYTFKATVSGDIEASQTLEMSATADPKRIYVSADAVVLNRGTAAASATIYVWTTGYYDGAAVLSWQRDNSNAGCTWGKKLEDGRYPLIITANSAGTTVITLASKGESGEILDSVTVTVKVDAETYTISYDANGGTGVPDNQTKTQGVNLVLTSQKPEREGHIFLGWATRSDAATAEYQPGTTFLLDADTKLYAIWSESFLTGDANIDGTVNMKDWNCLYEHSNEVAGIEGDAYQLADVNGDGKVNMKDWTRLYEHVCEINPLW